MWFDFVFRCPCGEALRSESDVDVDTVCVLSQHSCDTDPILVHASAVDEALKLQGLGPWESRALEAPHNLCDISYRSPDTLTGET